MFNYIVECCLQNHGQGNSSSSEGCFQEYCALGENRFCSGVIYFGYNNCYFGREFGKQSLFFNVDFDKAYDGVE